MQDCLYKHCKTGAVLRTWIAELIQVSNDHKSEAAQKVQEEYAHKMKGKSVHLENWVRLCWRGEQEDPGCGAL